MKDPEMCEVRVMVQSDQQFKECIQSIILEQPEPMYDSYPFEDSVENEVHLVDIIVILSKKLWSKFKLILMYFITNACLIFMEQNIIMDSLSFS